MPSQEKAPKSGEPAVAFSFTTMLQHTGQFGSRFLSKEQRNNTAAPPHSPDLAPSDF